MTVQEFKTKYHLTLDPQQEAAVAQTEGPVLLLAVPGSGKTTVLVARLGYLIYARGVDPRNLLTVTYTVAATADMKRRFAARFGPEHADAIPFRTINALCSAIIWHYARVKGTEPFALADDGQLNAVLRDLLARTGTEWPGEQHIRDARTNITYCKNAMLSESAIHAHRVEGMDFPAVYFEYQDYLNRSRLMDFDDQMVLAWRILRKYPDILAWYQHKYPYICVDEAQDTSKIQHAILALLAGQSRNLFLVGDEDQSIYGFRAAWPQALLNFEQTWPGAKVLLMETNYRSTPAIVDRADAFIRLNSHRRLKHMATPNPQGAPIRRVVLEDLRAQYSYLVKVARDCDRPTAVLYRNNDSALPLIDRLEREGVPYACRQREGVFFSSPIVRDMVDILTFAYDQTDQERFFRFYYKLDLKLKKSFLAAGLAHRYPGENLFAALLRCVGLEGWQVGRVKAMQTHFAKLSELSAYSAVQRVVKYMGYGDYLRDQRMDTSKLTILLALAAPAKTPAEFLARLEELRGVLAGDAPSADCPFVLSTIHAAKGLEYERVILMDAVDGVFPAVAEPSAREPGDEEIAAIEEERRLFYVAVTRAKEQLDLLVYREKFGETAGTASTFIDQLTGEATPSPSAAPASFPGRPAAVPSAAAPVWALAAGMAVAHKSFGPGTVESVAGSIAVIHFPGAGTKKVDWALSVRKGILRPADVQQ